MSRRKKSKILSSVWALLYLISFIFAASIFYSAGYVGAHIDVKYSDDDAYNRGYSEAEEVYEEKINELVGEIDRQNREIDESNNKIKESYQKGKKDGVKEYKKKIKKKKKKQKIKKIMDEQKVLASQAEAQIQNPDGNGIVHTSVEELEALYVVDEEKFGELIEGVTFSITGTASEYNLGYYHHYFISGKLSNRLNNKYVPLGDLEFNMNLGGADSCSENKTYVDYVCSKNVGDTIMIVGTFDNDIIPSFDTLFNVNWQGIQ